MNAPDEQIRSAFDQLIERRQRTTNVAAALTRVKQRQPWWRRFALPMTLGAIGASTAVVLLAVFVWSGNDTTTVEPPAVATQPSEPTEPQNVLIADNDDDAIRLYVVSSGGNYAGDCDEIADAQATLCSTPKPVEDGGGRVYALSDTTSGDLVEDLFLLDNATSTRVVDNRPAGYSLHTGLWEDGVSFGKVRWATPDKPTTALQRESASWLSNSFAEQVFGDVYVGVNELPQSPEDNGIDGPCDSSLLHIDSATGKSTEVANGFNPRLSGDGRYLAYETTSFEGEVPATIEECIYGTEMVVRDLFDDSERVLSLVDASNDSDVIYEGLWAPGSHRIFVTAGAIPVGLSDSTMTIVELGLGNDVAYHELVGTPSELAADAANRVLHWESDEVVVVGFQPENGSSEQFARFSSDGEFLSEVGPEDQPLYDMESVTVEEWHDIIRATPGFDFFGISGDVPEEVRIGNAHGLFDFSATTMFNADLDEDGDDEVIFALRNPDGPGFTGVLVYTMGGRGPVLVGPTTFYEEFPEDVIAVEYSDKPWGNYGTQSLAITQELAEDGDSAATGQRVLTYAMPNGELEIVGDTE